MTAAVRFIFGHSADGVTLISRQRVDMMLPVQDSPAEDAMPDAFVAELRDAGESVLHRTAIPNPLETNREAFSEDPDRSIARIPVAEPRGAFTVVVPDAPDADHLALLAAGPTRDKDGALFRVLEERGPREIARFPLHDPDEAGDQPQ